MLQRYSFIIIGLFGITAVALGAFGAHAWRATLTARGSLQVWETAVTYQFIHTLALLTLVLCRPTLRDGKVSLFPWTVRFWIAGVVLFSGSVYVLALGGPSFFGPITPLGGLAFILGWGSLIIEARSLSKTR